MVLLAALLLAALPARAMYGLQRFKTYYRETGGPQPGAGLGVLAGDVTGDGLDDVLFLYARERVASYIRVFRQTPDTHVLEAAGTYPVVPNGTGYVHPSSLDKADLDEDGIDDIIVGHGAGVSVLNPAIGFAISEFIENRTGDPPPGPNFPVPGYTGARVARSGDLDGDGHQDIALLVGNSVGQTAALWVYRGNGAGHFDAGTILPMPQGACFHDLRVVDMNKDGHEDLLTRAVEGACSFTTDGNKRGYWVYYNQGNGTFGGMPVQVVSDESTFSGVTGGGMSVGDMDGDGFPDIGSQWADRAEGIEGGKVYFHTGLGVPYGKARTWQARPGGTNLSSLIHDMNQDGKQDFLFDEWTGESDPVTYFKCYVNYAPHYRAPRYRYRFLCGNGIDNLTVGDINNDGLPDLVGTDYWRGFGWALGTNAPGIGARDIVHSP